ncbi:MAG: M1 family aminopeptidase [Chloroflexota bacterium]
MRLPLLFFFVTFLLLSTSCGNRLNVPDINLNGESKNIVVTPSPNHPDQPAVATRNPVSEPIVEIMPSVQVNNLQNNSLSLSDALPEYVIQIDMNYDTFVLEVKQELVFTNTTNEAIRNITLAVQPNRIPGVFILHKLAVNGINLTDYSLSGQRLTFQLITPLVNRQHVQISIEYRLNLPLVSEIDPNLNPPRFFGVNQRQVNLSDWYPMLVPFFTGKGWQLEEPLPYGEHLSYTLASFDITIRFANNKNIPVIAASAEGEPVSAGYHYSLISGRNFVFAMGRHLEVLTEEVDGVSISSYYFPGYKIAAKAVLDSTVKSFKLYENLFGTYHHKSLVAVQGDFNDGMEYEGFYYLSNSFYNLYDNSPNNLLVMLAAHETSHQWWFGQVASDQANQPWQDESLATYSEKLFYEKYYPKSVDWWWSYRIDHYHPTGKIDRSVSSYGSFTPYTNSVYRQGARFFDKLRQMLGDKAFFLFLSNYVKQMDGLIATPADFFRILALQKSVDLSELINTYFSEIQK